MKVALVYDRVNKWGGAERILLALHTLFPDAPLYTAVYDAENAPWADGFSIQTSFLQRFPFARNHHEWYPWLTPLAFESFNFDGYDLVISVTSADAKGSITKPDTKHICYCLTPTRYLWSHYETYFSSSASKFVAYPITSYLKKWDRLASSRPDVFIAISRTVKDRIRKYYDRDAEIIYPPVNSRITRIKNIRIDSNNRFELLGNYFLVVSRLVRYKRIDIAIKACNKLKVPLLIVGSGSEKKYLQSIAGPQVYFIDNLTDQELAWYYQQSQALIMPQEEDFGLVSVEAQMMGTPVISYKRGGALETIVEGVTGTFFYPQTEDALVSVLERFNKQAYNTYNCIANAKKFETKRFTQEF